MSNYNREHFKEKNEVGIYERLEDKNKECIPSKGWGEKNAYFKWEKVQINIGLGQGSALEKFNENIKEYEIIKIINEVQK